MTPASPFRRPDPRLMPAHGLEAVVARGRRRLVAGSGSAVCGVLVVAVVLLGGGPGTESLQPILPVGGPSPTPSGEPSPAPSSSSPVASASPSPEPTASGTPPSSEKPMPEPTTSPDPAPTPSPYDGPRYPWHQPVTTGPDARADRCESFIVRQDTDDEFWCVQHNAEAQWPDEAGEPASLDDPFEFSFWLCVPPQDTGAHRFDFDTAQEVDFTVTDDAGVVVWRWSTGLTFDAAIHSRDVPPGTCVRWGTSWNATTDDGTPAPAGRYLLDAYVTAEGWEGSVVDDIVLRVA